MNVPKISVCIPAYNHAGFIAQAIESVLGQICADYELLIIDDCSRDDTTYVIRSCAEKDTRIRCRINPTNLGMVANWNACLEEARGEYIKFLCSDDLLSSPHAVAQMAARLDGDRSVALVASARNFIDVDSGVIRTLDPLKGSGEQSGKVVINRCLREQHNLIGEPTAVMFRKSDGRRGFLPYYRQIVDLEMWFHLLEKGKLSYIDAPLCSFRIHAGQQTERNTNTLNVLDDNVHLCREYMDKPYVSIGYVEKRFIQCDNVYKMWKMHRRGLVGKEAAVEAIEKWYGYRRFRVIYPAYKVYKPLRKLKRRIRRLCTAT